MDMPKVLPPHKKITFLGHAGFMIETAQELILMDPWLSESGAYDLAWFQYPCNHHLADMVRRKVEETPKKVLVYVSHEHRDHLDEEFLYSLPAAKVTLLMPEFTRDFLYLRFHNWEGGVFFFKDGERFRLNNGYLEFYIHDSIREADSAVLFHLDIGGSFNFLNMNDCHIQDRVAQIKEDNGFINVLAGHFSGASWFPTCYDYDEKTYAAKSKRNKYARFSSLCKLIEDIQPLYYIPSAGPACFLGIQLFAKNFEEDSIFPGAADFYDFWCQWKGDLSKTFFAYHRPGEKLFYTRVKEPPRPSKREYRDELWTYRDKVKSQLMARNDRPHGSWSEVLEWLQSEMQQKLAAFDLLPDFYRLILTNYEKTDKVLMVDFQNRNASIIKMTKVPEGSYVISAHEFEWGNLMEGYLTWYEWLLSFRFNITRTPDEFDPILDGFLVNEGEDLPAFCLHYRERLSDERIVVHTDRKHYKVCRKCPHEGADLTNAWVDGTELVCPRHNWRFDLENGGKCDIHKSTINAVEVGDVEEHSSAQA